VINALVSKDGQTGKIPTLMRRIRADGARVIYVGYLRNPGVNTSIKSCGPAGNELERRLQRTATLIPGMTYVSVADLVPSGDRSYHQQDQVHPTVKGSAAIARRVMEAM
jgi:acyl-CoA thioesterase I